MATRTTDDLRSIRAVEPNVRIAERSIPELAADAADQIDHLRLLLQDVLNIQPRLDPELRARIQAALLSDAPGAGNSPLRGNSP